uniref:Uncharacterized protein n=1 Tax=Rhizophora mucronata TaxID=61149 RepID=A0A2P2PMN1_RHIMU
MQPPIDLNITQHPISSFFFPFPSAFFFFFPFNLSSRFFVFMESGNKPISKKNRSLSKAQIFITTVGNPFQRNLLSIIYTHQKYKTNGLQKQENK